MKDASKFLNLLNYFITLEPFCKEKSNFLKN